MKVFNVMISTRIQLLLLLLPACSPNVLEDTYPGSESGDATTTTSTTTSTSTTSSVTSATSVTLTSTTSDASSASTSATEDTSTISGTSDSDATSTTGGDCGDGITDPGEECDDGNDVDDDACSNNCLLPVCGDGIVEGDEECDDGNDVDDDSCPKDCTPECGDSMIQGDEECDGDEGCTGQCKWERRLVFVTKSEFNGKLSGVSGADSKCQTAADNARLPGIFGAWISTPNDTPSERWAVYFGDFKGKFVLPGAPDPLPKDGTETIASGWDGEGGLLSSESLGRPINKNEYGMMVDGVNSWTATAADGTFYGGTCGDWTKDDGSGGSGSYGWNSAIDGQWTHVRALGCSSKLHLYCFQVSTESP